MMLEDSIETLTSTDSDSDPDNANEKLKNGGTVTCNFDSFMTIMKKFKG